MLTFLDHSTCIGGVDDQLLVHVLVCREIVLECLVSGVQGMHLIQWGLLVVQVLYKAGHLTLKELSDHCRRTHGEV